MNDQKTTVSRGRPSPFRSDAAAGFVTWLVALMVFLTMLSAAVALTLQETSQSWRSAVDGRMTVELPPETADDAAGESADAGNPDGDAATGDGAAASSNRIDDVVALLNTVDGVERVEPVADDEIQALLEPWLGADAPLADLPLPRLIDVTVAPGTALDLADVSERLEDVAPGARIDDHGQWLAEAVGALRLAEAVALSVMVIVAGVALFAVAFATRTGLAVQRDVVEILHLIGATDGYIASQFQRLALRGALKGALIGAGVAALALIILASSLARVAPAGFSPELPGGGSIWILAMIPFAAIIMTVATARLTVLRTLGRLP